jgi:hypothetical protein
MIGRFLGPIGTQRIDSTSLQRKRILMGYNYLTKEATQTAHPAKISASLVHQLIKSISLHSGLIGVLG